MEGRADGTDQWRNWTRTGGASGEGFEERIARIEKNFRTHLGIDFQASGVDYPHPSQKVRALYFFEGFGRLDPTGLQFLTSSTTQRGIYWLPEFSDSPNTYVPSARMAGQIDDPTGDPVVFLNQTLNATADDVAFFQVSAAGPTGTNTTGMFIQMENSALVASVAAYVNPLTASDRALQLTNLPLYLEAVTSDFPLVSDGMMWYRGDTDKFRGRVNGVSLDFLMSDYVPPALPSSNKQPIATKTTTYTTTNADGVILCDATAGAFTVTLVTASGNTGLTQTFKKTDSTASVVTIDANGSQTIDGSLTYALSQQWTHVTLVSNGSNWMIVGQG